MNTIEQALQQLSNGSLSVQSNARLFFELFVSIAGKQRPQIVIAKDFESFNVRLRNLRFFQGSASQMMRALPASERSIMHATASDPLLTMERMATRFSIAEGQVPPILLMPPQALLEKFPGRDDLRKHAQLLIVGEKIDRQQLLASLMMLGYAKVPLVIDKGTFAVRGSVIDIFINGHQRPVRVDLFGDEIESLKYFDENSQRSIERIDSIVIGGVREIFFDRESKAIAQEKLAHLSDELNFPTQKLNEKLRDIENGISFYGIEKMLPAFFTNLSSLLELILAVCKKDQLPQLVFDDKEAIFARLKEYEEATERLYEEAIIRQELLFTPQDYFISTKYLSELIKAFPITDISTKTCEASFSFATLEVNDIRQDIVHTMASNKDKEVHLLSPLAKRIKKLHQEGVAVFIALSSREHEAELKTLLEPFSLNINSYKERPDWLLGAKAYFKPHVHAFTIVNKTPLAFGAFFKFLDIALIAEDDIFGHRTKRKGVSGKQQGFATALSELELGDLVVHLDHGIGRFAGLVRLLMRGIENDYVLITYANEEKLYLPVHRINLIKPHGGAKDGSVRVDKLGGTAWQTKKSKVKEAVMAMAQDLIKLYAKRSIVERPPFFAPDTHFHEFEAAFAFECTPDQQKAIDDVLNDMQRKQPMDRLVCGDVGYGKTEVAMRAAMLAILSKRQVAILAPTTVLAQQHGITFQERFKNTGAQIAVLSRFQKASEIANIIKQIKENKVDVVIGTHRLLSPDVQFHDLALMVVDEEQRFGIKAKEHLKKMRSKVDVLTMSATPIPRTLQMSYFGIRDLSIIETPPVDRRAIQTQIVQFDDAVIKEAILREIARGGQVYFVHNRISSIEATADYLRRLVPEARITVAHGQMGEDDLEKKMLSFMAHEINVLVCTTIIETGIDVSTANTMFIDNADDFGLSQLYQLRGRIGRSSERAFAYLLIKGTTEQLTPIAKTRLEILHRFSELGAGFRIAQHDLELRGAGDLLGKNQHGHMAAVGYDLYAELLGEAVKSLKGQGDEEAIEPEVILPLSAMISEKYCPDLHDRMSFYQRLASADSGPAIEGIIAEMEDLYGHAPDEVLALATIALIKLELKRIFALKLELIKAGDDRYNVGITLQQKSPIDAQKLAAVMANPDAPIRVTPQQKLLQVIPSISHDHQALLAIAKQAIARIKQDLFI